MEFPRWPVYAPFLALLMGIGTSILLVGVGAGVVRAAGTKVTADSPGFTDASTFALDVCVVAASIFFASVTARPKAWHFGLRRSPLGPSLLIVLGALGAFFLFEIVYAALVKPERQNIIKDIGANQSTLLLILGALMVIVVAPFCEELFFRGFLFRCLRLRMPFWPAAIIDGVLFGAVHGGITVIPILAFLGVVLCYVYERTGTLFATIAIHALNNMISYGASTDNGWSAALPIGLVVLGSCVLVPRALPRAPAPA